MSEDAEFGIILQLSVTLVRHSSIHQYKMHMMQALSIELILLERMDCGQSAADTDRTI